MRLHGFVLSTFFPLVQVNNIQDYINIATFFPSKIERTSRFVHNNLCLILCRTNLNLLMKKRYLLLVQNLGSLHNNLAISEVNGGKVTRLNILINILKTLQCSFLICITNEII